MTRQRPSDTELRGMLGEGHFAESQSLSPADPITPTQMLLEIDRIAPYDHNPRKERNPQYDEIKESVRARGGLNNPFTITRRPGADRYTIESGGNTRLQVLEELWQETGDERFYRVHCLFRPWVSEVHVLTAHLVENDRRGDLIFIDRARAVRQLREIIEEESGHTLSLRQLSDELTTRGYRIDPGSLSRMDYAVDVLLPVIPEALLAGLGRPQINRLRRPDTAGRRYWTDDGGKDPEQFDRLFSEVLTAHDSAEWDLDAVQSSLEARMAEVLERSIKHVRLGLDAQLASAAEKDRPRTAVVSAEPSRVPEERPDRTPSAAATSRATPAAKPTPVPASGTATGGVASQDAASEKASSTPRTETIDTTPALDPLDQPYQGPGDLKSLRSRGYVLALRAAQRHGLAECISAAPGLGMGYLIDLPREPLTPVPGEENALQRLYDQWVWWLLLSFSEEVVNPERLAQVPEEILLRNLILERNEDSERQVFAMVGEPDWKALGYEMLSNPGVDDRTIAELLALVQTCRQIRRQAGDDGELKLWQRKEGGAPNPGQAET